MEVRICDKCKGFKYKEVMDALNKNFPNIKYTLGCNNMCGIGRSKVVAVVNNHPLVADTVEELIEKIKKSNF